MPLGRLVLAPRKQARRELRRYRYNLYFGADWALVWNSMQYLLTAKLVPLRIQALATSIAMTLHFVNSAATARSGEHAPPCR